MPSIPRPAGRFGLFWDESGSPWSVYRSPATPTTRFRAIDLSAITGLTFFYGDKGYAVLEGIHAHTSAAPTASAPQFRKHTWVHVPISSKDEVTALAVRRGLSLNNLLVRVS